MTFLHDRRRRILGAIPLLFLAHLVSPSIIASAVATLCAGGFLAALELCLAGRKAAPAPANPDGKEQARFNQALDRLSTILGWLEARSALATSQSREAEAILTVTESATFEARNKKILNAYESGSRVSLENVDLTCVTEVEKNMIGEDKEDAVVQLVALDTLLLGFWVSDETYRQNAPAYGRFVQQVGRFMRYHGTAFTHQMRRTLGCIAEDLGDAGLLGEAGHLKESLGLASQARKEAARIRQLKLAERSVPALSREELLDEVDLAMLEQGQANNSMSGTWKTMTN
jgi:predicted secreted protein